MQSLKRVLQPMFVRACNSLLHVRLYLFKQRRLHVLYTMPFLHTNYAWLFQYSICSFTFIKAPFSCNYLFTYLIFVGFGFSFARYLKYNEFRWHLVCAPAGRGSQNFNTYVPHDPTFDFKPSNHSTTSRLKSTKVHDSHSLQIQFQFQFQFQSPHI